MSVFTLELTLAGSEFSVELVPIVFSGGGSAAWGGITGTLSNQTDLQAALSAKQAVLVSATNIKTVNGASILGAGDLVVTASTAWGAITGTLTAQTDLQSALDGKQDAIGFTPYNATNPSGYITIADVTFTNLSGKPTTLAGYGITDAQAIDADLTAIAALAGTSGLLKKTAANTWELDTSTYLTVVPAQTWASITGKPTTISGYGITDFLTQTLTGYASGANTVLASGDTLLAALGKVQAQITARLQYTPNTATSDATLTPAAGNDFYAETALANAITIANPIGTWADGSGFVVRLKDNGTARAISFGANYRAVGMAALPTTTTLGKTMYIPAAYNAAESKFDVFPALVLA